MNWPPVPSSRSRVINPSDHLGQRPPWREQRLVSSFSVDKVNDLDYSIPLQRQRLAIVGRWNSLLQNREAQLSMTAEEILELFELGLLIPKLYRGLNEDHFFTPRTPAFSLVYTTVDLDLPSLFSVHELLDPHLKRRILPVNGTFLDLPSILEHYSYVLLQHGQYMTNPEPSSFHFRFYLFDKLDYIKDGFLLLFGRGSIDTPKARRVHPCLKNRTSLWPKTIQHYLENEATYTGCFATSAGQQIGEVATWGTNEWTVVALGNLEPKIECNPSSSTSQPKALQSEDIESHLYQTIGHDSIPVFNYVLGIPLYRAQILGSRVDPSRTYRSPYPQREQDETEDLRRLLILILQQHPEAKYICTGAILSDYQRTRVENVCNQLGLTSVAPLWQYPGLPISRPGSAEKYAGLLQDMQTTGMEARIIKTASAGLSLDNLWEDVCSTKVRKRLLRSMSKYVSGDDLEAAVIGEGGEYETLCVNGPPIVWRGRLVFDDDAFQPVRGEAGSAHLRVPRPRIEWHSPEQSVAPPSPTIPRDVPSLPIPQLFDAGTWIAYQTALNSSSAGEQVHPSEAARKIGNLQLERDDLTKVHKPVNSAADSIDKCRLPSRIILQCRDTLLISNLTEEAKDIAEQSTGIFQTLLRLLYDHGLSVHHLTQLVICLRSMQHFAAINAVYSRFFGHTDPPTRVTTACGAILPLGCELIVHASASFADPALHHALYVRSISYWAPANIAPYSQAIKLAPRLGKSGLNEDGPSMLAVPTSGQIPLVPMTMNLPTLAEMSPYLSSGGEIGFRIALAAQHLWRVGQVMKVKWWTDAVAFIAAGEEPSVNSSRSVAKHVSIATKFWLERCRLDHPVFEEDSPTEDEGADPELQRQQLDWSLVEHETKDDPSACVQAIPFFTVEVQALPRGVSVEFHAMGYLLNPQVSSESVSRRPIYIRSVLDHRIQVPGLACQLSVDLVMTEIQGLRVSAQGTATVAGPAAAEFPVADLSGCILAILNAADDSDPRRRSVWKPSLMTLYAVSLGPDEVEEPVTGHRAQPRCPIRWMPVKRVFDKQRRLCDFGFVLELEEAASIGTPA